MNDLDRFILKFEASSDKYLPENYKSLQRHFRKIANNSKMEDTTRQNHYITLMKFGEWCKIPFMELKEDDILDYCEFLSRFTRVVKEKHVKYNESTLYYYKSFLKRFLRDVRPDLCKSIELAKVSHKKAPADMLTREEVEKLIDACLNNRDRALIAVLYESGARKGEILSTQIKHVTFDTNGAIMFFPDSKTFERRIRLVFSASYLRQWLETHPRKEEINAPLFCSFRKPHNVISNMGLTDQLNELQNRSGIKKHITAHLFRHSRATHLSEHLTEQQLKKYLGWTEASSMASVYVHLSGKDIDNAILKMNGILIDDTHGDGLKVGRCPRCKDLNPETSLYCGKCGMPLRDEGIKRLETESDEFEMMFSKLIAENPNLLKSLDKYKKND